jgi:flagellar export protein FliJ
MKQFSFKLDQVLAYRKLVEDTQEQKLYVIQTAILNMQKTRDDLRTKIDLCGNKLSERSCGAIDIEEVRILSTYLERLNAELASVLKSLAKLEQARIAQLEIVLEARRGREIMEKIRDNSFSEYKKETEALERKMLDELSVTQFGRLNKQELPTASSLTRKT